MFLRRLAALTAVALLTTPSTLPASGAPTRQASSELCRLSDRRIDEASGIARGIRSPGVFYVQNDSGDSARFFAINTRTCDTEATVTVAGARNVDWEDIAVAPDAAGTPSVWLADIGDNNANRPEIDIYRVDEPKLSGGPTDEGISVPVADEWRLQYPTGPVNAESLAVAPNGTAYVIAKSVIGMSTVYRVPSEPSATRVQELAPIATITFHLTGTPDPFGAAGELAATGAAVSPDGALLVVRTYSDAYLWRIRDDDIAAAVRRTPTRVALPQQPQGEGVGFFNGRLVIDSEQVGTAVYSVAVPPVPTAVSTATGTAPASSRAPSSSSNRSNPSPSTSSAVPHQHGSGGWTTGLIVLGLLAVLAAAFWIAQLTGNRRGR